MPMPTKARPAFWLAICLSLTYGSYWFFGLFGFAEVKPLTKDLNALIQELDRAHPNLGNHTFKTHALPGKFAGCRFWNFEALMAKVLRCTDQFERACAGAIGQIGQGCDCQSVSGLGALQEFVS